MLFPFFNKKFAQYVSEKSEMIANIFQRKKIIEIDQNSINNRRSQVWKK